MQASTEPIGVGFTQDEIDTGSPTRNARLKWAIVVDAELPAGRAVNAAICAAAATAVAVPGLLGPDAVDANGVVHPGLPWAGCTILSAANDQLQILRAKAQASDGMFVADMPSAAQHTRVYDEYLREVAAVETDGVDYYAVSIVGPKNRVDRLIGRLPLMS